MLAKKFPTPIPWEGDRSCLQLLTEENIRHAYERQRSAFDRYESTL